MCVCVCVCVRKSYVAGEYVIYIYIYIYYEYISLWVGVFVRCIRNRSVSLTSHIDADDLEIRGIGL